MLKNNKIIFIGLLVLIASVILINPIFAQPKTAKPWDSNSDDNDFWSDLGFYDNISDDEIESFLDDYKDFVNSAKEAYIDKDVKTLRRLNRESLTYEDKFFTYKKSDNWTSKDTSTFVSQTKTLERYLLNRFYEKSTSSSGKKGKNPPTKI